MIDLLFDTGQVLADEKWFKSHLSEEDLGWVEKHAPKFQQLEAKTIKCTVCNECLNFKLLGQVQRHPELGALIPFFCLPYAKSFWLLFFPTWVDFTYRYSK
jgi:hypothetical protein